MKTLPIGKSDFKEIIEYNSYYLDKTLLIEELLKENFKVQLFTRPRRFGKTLNMSMLKYFFDIENAEENKKLFKSLAIEKSEYLKEQGQYPVVFISFKDLEANNWEEMIIRIKNLLSEVFSNYKHLVKGLDEFDLPIFKKIINEELDISNLKSVLRFLTKILYEKYDKKVVLLIDEYDKPIISAYEHGYYNKAISFFKSFYSLTLKDNSYLRTGVMTGILQVAKEGIFSGLNNLMVHNILENRYTTYFGLTEEEVKNTLTDYDLKENISDVKKWYNGYKFGNSEIYNPWSILNYLYGKELKAYWINTSSNELIYEALEKSEEDVFNELRELFEDKSIQKTINASFNFQDIRNLRGIWQLFVYSGYLKIDESLGNNIYSLKIPNYEVKSFFEESFINHFLGNQDSFREMLIGLKKKDIREFERKLQQVFKLSISYNDIGKEEKYYHNLLLGMILAMQNEYNIDSNREDGYGRYDIFIEPKNKLDTGFILEFKVAESEEELEKKSLEAIEQVKEKEYFTSMKNNGIKDILVLGIAFYKKKIKVSYEKI